LAILEIQLRKRDLDPAQYGTGLTTLAKAAIDYTGAELEQIVKQARKHAYNAKMTEWEDAGSNPGSKPTEEDVRPTIEHMTAAKSRVTPIAVLDKESVNEIREFCRERARPVNGKRVGKQRASRRVSTGRARQGSDPQQL